MYHIMVFYDQPTLEFMENHRVDIALYAKPEDKTHIYIKEKKTQGLLKFLQPKLNLFFIDLTTDKLNYYESVEELSYLVRFFEKFKQKFSINYDF